MTFRLPHAPLRQDDEEQPDETEEVLRTEREDFFPIKQPTSLAELEDSHLMDESGELRAESLEGVWCVASFSPREERPLTVAGLAHTVRTGLNSATSPFAGLNQDSIESCNSSRSADCDPTCAVASL